MGAGEAFHHVIVGGGDVIAITATTATAAAIAYIFFLRLVSLFVSSFKYILCVYFIVTIFDYTIDRWLLLSLLLLLLLLLSLQILFYVLRFFYGVPKGEVLRTFALALFFLLLLLLRCVGRYASLYIFIRIYLYVYRMKWSKL